MKSITWIGKLLGFLIGALIFGPIGAIVGGFIGHAIDGAGRAGARANAATNAPIEAQRLFFNAAFLVMGHIAKADGHVSEDDIRMARATMQRMGLNDTQRLEAMRLFSEGKSASFQLNDTLHRLDEACRHHRALLRLFVEIQVQAAYAEGQASPEQQRILQQVCQALGMRPLNFTLLNMLHGRFQQQGPHSSHYSGGQQRSSRASLSINECYAILDIDSRATDAEVKRAYRKLMSQHHPDKLVAKGLPEAMMKVATEKTQNIQRAYEHIRQARGIK